MAMGNVVAAGVSAALVAGGVGLVTSTQASGVAVTPNPKVQEACEMDFSLMLDASGSIQSAGAVNTVREAARTFLTALNLDATGSQKSTVRLAQFATGTNVLADRAQVTTASLAVGGVFHNGLAAYYKPQPDVPANGTYEYDGSGDWKLTSNWKPPTSSRGWTNWDGGLKSMLSESKLPEVAIFITDGDPTAFNLDRAGDPNGGEGSDHIGFNTLRGTAATPTQERAVERANALKAAGVRVLVVGVGSGITEADSKARMMELSGPQIVEGSALEGITSINDVDVAVVQEFDKLGAFLRGVVSTACDNDPNPPEPTPTPTPAKPEQKPADDKGRPPISVKTDGVTVITKAGAKTNAGQAIRTRIRCTLGAAAAGQKRLCTVIRGRKGKTSVRTYGVEQLKIIALQYAPGTPEYRAYRKRTVYVDGKKRWPLRPGTQ